ncbi:MAG: energy transducer TonB [Proteobacteria bacterium]|nr:energy transducer TonB [Pseudomonadota bacterium]
MTSRQYRIIAALTVSLSVHIFLFQTEFNWAGEGRSDAVEPRRVTMTLAARQTVRPPEKKTGPESFSEIPATVVPLPVVHAPPFQSVQGVDVTVRELPRPVILPAQELFAQNELEMQVAEELMMEPEALEPQMDEQLPVQGEIIQLARPLYKKNPPPKYPASARRNRQEGTVLLEVFVNDRGRVEELKIFRTSSYKALDRVALAAVENWEFEPGLKNGKPVSMWVRVPVRFVLK